MLHSERGFTLLELMIVIVIMGILTSIALPLYARYTRTAKEVACLTTRQTLFTGSALFYGEHNAWPTGVDDLSEYLANPEAFTCPSGGTYGFSDDGSITCDADGHSDVVNP